MFVNIYAIKDELAELWSNIFCLNSKTSMRTFQFMAKEKQEEECKDQKIYLIVRFVEVGRHICCVNVLCIAPHYGCVAVCKALEHVVDVILAFHALAFLVGVPYPSFYKVRVSLVRFAFRCTVTSSLLPGLFGMVGGFSPYAV